MAFELHEAINSSNYDLAVKLIEAGADVNEINECDKTPLVCAEIKNDVDLVNLLINNGAKAILFGSYNHVYSALIHFCRINQLRKSNDTEKYKKYKIIEKMLENTNINELSNGLDPALLIANTNYVPIVELFLIKGMTISLVNSINTFVQTDAEKDYKTSKAIISYGLLSGNLKNKSDFIRKNEALSNHFDEVEKKINYLYKNPFIGCKTQTENILNKVLYKKNSLKALSFTKFFKFLNVDAIESSISNETQGLKSK